MAKTSKNIRKLQVAENLSPMQMASKIVRDGGNEIESREEALKALAVLKQAQADFNKLIVKAYEDINNKHIDIDEIIKEEVEYAVDLPYSKTVFKYTPKVTLKYGRGVKASDNTALQKVFPELIEEKTTLYLKSKKQLELSSATLAKAMSDGYIMQSETKELKETMKQSTKGAK